MLAQSGVRLRRLTTVAVALYAVFLVASPFAHHDLQCELRTPLHCTACAATALGSDLQTDIVAGLWHLDDAGSAVIVQIAAPPLLLSVCTFGRSPPSLS
jgi:hypothetical protein